MAIDIHSLLEKNLVTKTMLKPKFGYKYLGPYNGPLEKQMLYNKRTGDIYKYYDKPKNVLDKIASRHDICYELKPKNKGLCDRIMVKEIDNIPFKEKPWGTFAIKQIINTKQKLGLGNNFTMEDLSEELNKPVINKFERKKIIVNHIDEIHSCDLVDMQKYSKVNRGYKYIFTNIDIFSKYSWSFPIKSKKISDIKPCFEKIFKERKPKYIWSDQESSFFSKEMLKFFEDNNVKIYYTYSNLKAVVIERFNRSLRELMMKAFVKNNNTVWYNILPKLIKTYNNRYHRTIKMKPIYVNKLNEKHIKNTVYNYNIINKKPKYKINDIVRISLKRRELFDKSTGNIKWSEELFKIYKVNKSNVITYQIKDMNDEIIKGIFYEKELQLTKNTSDVYIIEKILKTKGENIFVKWRNYDSSFNSWVKKSDIKNIYEKIMSLICTNNMKK